LRLAFIGWGAIARTAARLLDDSPVQIVAIATRDATRPRPDLPPDAALITDPGELAATRPVLVIEAAGRQSVAQWAPPALEAGADVIISSVSALADTDLLASLSALARRHDAQLHISPGALGGIDALSAARAMGIDAVEHRIVKPPDAWKGTPAEDLVDLETITGPVTLFTGPADQAATEFPKNANVAMTTALAGVGPAATQITLVADPAAGANRHEITAHGAFGEMSVTMRNAALEENPKTSAMAALSLVRAVENRVRPLTI
jgi:aspartate dehydrogenase